MSGAILKYKYSKGCLSCKYFKYHPKEKLVLANIRNFNNYSHMTVLDFQKIYTPDLSYASLRKHVNNHISIVKPPPVNTIVPHYEGKRESQESKQLALKSEEQASKEDFENTLDEFISQFDEAIRLKQLKLTVKDGLQALKIKADLVSKNKDRKADILKKMIGARGERIGPAERTET